MAMRAFCSLVLTLLSAAVLAPAAHAHPLDGIILPALRDYFVLGVEHILTGYDHLLFVAGLVIATRQLRALVWTISAFTLAHSLTLGLGMLGVVTPSAVAVELLIALSIAYVGYENLRLGRAPRGRVWLVMLFGLAHGFGFAGAIAEVGFEAGQLCVVAALWPLLALVRKRERVALRIAWLVNVALIVAGIGWTLERSFSAPEPGASANEVAQRAIMPATAPAPTDVAFSVRERAHVPAWVSDVCHALQRLPRERRAACAGVKPGVSLASACESTLAASIAAGALQVDETRAEQCVEEMHARYEGCEWTEARWLPPINACQTFAAGLKRSGETCSSALECVHGLFCHGAGPFDRGVCGPPRQDGARCELAADPLASYLPAAPQSHPECEGRCIRGRCASESADNRARKKHGPQTGPLTHSAPYGGKRLACEP
jgi:hydrogenase/urease accessory protein HupE